MDGVHDMGGMDGFGKVEPEPNEPVFHAPWEGRVLAMQRAMGVCRRLEHRRVALRAGAAAAASLPRRSYYQTLGAGHGEQPRSSAAYADADELAAGHALRPGKPLKRASSRRTWSSTA